MEFVKSSLVLKTFIYGVISKKSKKTTPAFQKIIFKPFVKNEIYYIQFEYVYEKKVIHENLEIDEAFNRINELLLNDFKQMMFYDINKDYQVLISKKGKIKIIESKATRKLDSLDHNYQKKYLIAEGQPCDFLIELGIMDSLGKVKPSKYNKFRQINRFLELVEDVVNSFDYNETVKIVDFGCGKSYLTFALYYYLVKMKTYEVDIIGLDLKHDVIDFCNTVVTKLDYKGLVFKHGDIKEFEMKNSVDLIITLHACDTATDAALIKGIKWNVKNILSVPCCQHEYFNQIAQDNLNPLLKHGILKERISALVTDSLRGLYLEAFGYEVGIMEFIDMEHTPKNILIKANKKNEFNKELYLKCLEYEKYWNLDKIYLAESLKEFLPQ